MGPEAPVDVVLLSPRQARRVYMEFAPLLPSSVKVHMRDLLLACRSWDRDEWTLAAESAALECWLDGTGIRQCHLVAESGAAAVALVFATTSPQRLLSMTICEPPWVGADFPATVDVHFRQALRDLVDLPDEQVAPAFFRLMTNGLDPPARPFDLSLVTALRAVADEYVRAPFDRALLATVPIPALLLVGGSSTPRMGVITEELSQLLPRSVVVEIPGAHHFNLWRVGAHSIARAWVDHCFASVGPGAFCRDEPDAQGGTQRGGA